MAATTDLPVKFDLKVYRGDDYFVGLTYDEKDEAGNSTITSTDGWTALLQVRPSVGGTVWLALTETDGLTLRIGPAGLETTVHISNDRTEGEEWKSQTRGVWDFQLTSPDGIVTTPFAGKFALTQDVSREVSNA